MKNSSSSDFTIERNTVAAMMMFGHALLLSFFPVLVAYAGTDSPFIFAAIWMVASSFGFVVFLIIWYKTLFFDGRVWQLAWQRTPSWTFLIWVIGLTDLALFAWSAKLIDISVATVLYQLSPILTVLLIERLFVNQGRYHKIGPLKVFLFALAVGGTAMVIVSQAGGIGGISLGGASAYALALGVALAIGAAMLDSTVGFGFRWGVDLAAELPEVHRRTKDVEVFCVVFGAVVANLLVVPFIAAAGFARNESVTANAIFIALVGGPLVGTLPAVLWRTANLMTDNLGVNIARYFTPLLSLGWLYVLSLIGDVDFGFLFAGAFVIIFANIGVYIEGRQRSSQTSTPLDSPQDADITALITNGESETVEFKSSLRVNLHTRKRDERIQVAALKTIAAFLNSNGGTLVIGVADDGSPVGVEVDEFRNEDEMARHLGSIVGSRMDRLAVSYIRMSFEDYEGARVMRVGCEPSSQPVYVKEGNSEKFYIRTGPATIDLSISEANAYISDHFS